jgi:hypothetical protein
MADRGRDRMDEAAKHEPARDAGSRTDAAGPKPRAMTRRRFVGLVAAGASAALAAPALAATTVRRKTTRGTAAGTPAGPPPLPPRVAKGLDEQRTSLARTLKTVREFELPPGSEQGFAFRPVAARRRP